MKLERPCIGPDGEPLWQSNGARQRYAKRMSEEVDADRVFVAACQVLFHRMMTTQHEEQKERLAVLLNDGLVRKDTLASRAASDIAQENQGRFAKGTTITGSQAATLYPRLPANNPQNQMAMVPPEPPLGMDVNETPIVGEAWEVERSLQAESCDARNIVNVTNSVGAFGDQLSAPTPMPDSDPLSACIG